MAIDPQVVAIEDTIEAEHDALTTPLVGHGEGGAVVARQRQRLVVAGLAKPVCLPASWHGDAPPRLVGHRHRRVVCDALHNFQLPFSVQAPLHLRVGDGQYAVESIPHLRLRACHEQQQGHDVDQPLHHNFLYLSSIFVY